MEKHRELARQLNYTETIDCGALRIHVFHEDFLSINTESDKIIDITSCTFSRDEMPSVTSSVIEIFPSSPLQDLELTGCVNFEVPSDCVRGEFTKDVLLRRLLIHLDPMIDYIGMHLEFNQDELIINNPSQKPIHISLTIENYSDAYFELSAPLDASNPSHAYNGIIFSSTVWGHIHDFLVHASPLDFRNFKPDRSNDIYIGRTNFGEISDIEIAIESVLGKIALNDIHATLPEWSPNVGGHRLQKLGDRILTPGMIEDIAYSVVSQKRSEYGKTGSMATISESDIIGLMNQLL